MKVNGLTTKGKVLDNPFGGKAVTAYCAGLAVCFFHKVTLIQPEVYLGNALLDIYHIKIICEYLRKDTTQQLLGLHDAKITNTYEIMCLRGRGCNWVLRLTLNHRIEVVHPQLLHLIKPPCQFQPCRVLDASGIINIGKFHGQVIGFFEFRVVFKDYFRP